MFSCCLIPFIFRETQHNPVCTVATISPAIARPSLVLIWLQSQGAEHTAVLQSLLHNFTVPQFIHLCKLIHRVANKKQQLLSSVS